MSTPSRRRLMRDFKKLQDDPPAGVSGAPTEESIMRWEAVIFGPQDTPFEDGTFKLSLEFTEEYPNKPPTVKFVSKMFHPNVYADGSICLDILQNQWSPTYDVAAILTSIQSLLDEPNPNSPANSLAAQLYQENRREYEKRVHAIVEQSWMSFSEEDEDDGEKGTKEAEGSTNIDQTVTNTAQVDAEEDETQSSASSQENDEGGHHHHRGAEEPQQTQSEPPPEGQTSKSGSSTSPFPLLPLPPPGPGPSQSQLHIQTISRQIMAQIDQRRAASAPNTAAEGSTEEDERESEDVQVD